MQPIVFATKLTEFIHWSLKINLRHADSVFAVPLRNDSRQWALLEVWVMQEFALNILGERYAGAAFTF